MTNEQARQNVHLRTGNVISMRESTDVDGRKVWPVDLHILTGEPLYAKDMGVGGKTGWFIIDLETALFHKDSLTMDYNHDEKEIIGYAEDFTRDETGLHGKGFLVPFHEHDRASEIIHKNKMGVPYEMSPTVLPYAADVEDVPDEATAMVNGIEVTGPIRIYRQLPIRGIAICPYGTDRETSATVLSERKTMPTTVKPKGKLADDENKPCDTPETPTDEKNMEEDVTKAAHPDLEEFIAEFGFEDGVQFYREGLDIEEARKEEYAQLKADKQAAAELKDKEGVPAGKETDPKPAPAASSETAALKDEVKGLKQQIARLSASMPRGEREPISQGEPEKNQPKDKRPDVAKLSEAYAKKFGPKS